MTEFKSTYSTLTVPLHERFNGSVPSPCFL
jgi:hypothetical protein